MARLTGILYSVTSNQDRREMRILISQATTRLAVLSVSTNTQIIWAVAPHTKLFPPEPTAQNRLWPPNMKDLIFELWPPVIINFRLVVWELSSTKNYTRFAWGVGVPGSLSNDLESPEEPTTSRWRSSRFQVTSHMAWLLSQDMWLEEIAVPASLRALDLEPAPNFLAYLRYFKYKFF